MRNVLITGARAPIARDLARNFAAAGRSSHLADSVHPWIVSFERGAQGRLHRFASPRFAFDDFAVDLCGLVERLDPELIIPTCEEVFYVGRVAERFGFADRVFAPAPNLLRQFHSKFEFPELARRCGLMAPVTHRVRSIVELSAWKDTARAYVFKPEFSRFASHTLIRPESRAIGRLRPTAEHPWVVQDFVGGEEICIWSAAIAGEIAAFAAYVPRWRCGRSASFYFETDRDPNLLTMSRAVAKATGVTGQLSFDVIRRADGTLVPIECNPRGTSGIHLFDGDARLALAILGREGPALPVANARHLGLAMWLLGAPQALLRGDWAAFRRDVARSNDVLAMSREPRAALGALLDTARFFVTGLSHGRSASAQSTNDIEWNGEAFG